MTVAWNLFTPWASLAGGLLIGLASALYVLGNGRIAGIAGIVASPLRALCAPRPAEAGRPPWGSSKVAKPHLLESSGARLMPERNRLLFIVGLLLSPWVWRLFAPLPAATVDVGVVGLVVAGLLVGIGARMGNGCTSGHGVCGLSRLSPRSLVNVLAFMGAGVAAVFLLRHVL